MKKLLDIINLSQTHQCYQLQLDFKVERHNLKRYFRSLKELKPRLKKNISLISNYLSDANSMLEDQNKLGKKYSQLDYYIINGVKIFSKIKDSKTKVSVFYTQLLNQISDLINRIDKYLDQSKESFIKSSKQHEKVVKDYAQKCFPQTTSILYFLGFVQPEKIKKTQDQTKEQNMLKETQLYMNLLTNFLDQMEALRQEATQLCKNYYLGAAEQWTAFGQSISNQSGSYKINDDQMQNYYKQTGGAATDRSNRSMDRDNDQEFAI